MNIYDVSERAKVSIATVSRVLNGNPNVSERTRIKVLDVMKELGYTPNVFARGLGLNTMHTVGIMCSDSSDPYLANAIYFLERELRTHGYDSILCCTGNDLDVKQKYFHLLLSKRVDAIILAGSKFIEMKPKDNAYILEGAEKLPIMLVNGYLEGKNIYSTICDDRTAVYEAVKKLAAAGKKDIVYLYTSHSYSGINKRQGYQDALAELHIPIRQQYMIQCPKNVLKAKECLLSLARQNVIFDAIVTSDDTLAVGAVKYAHQNHLKIPADLAVIGYNNSTFSYCTDPELTSIDTKVEALCITTVNTLMGVFQESNMPAKTTIAADLIERETTNFI